MFADRLNQFDVRVGKMLKFGRTRTALNLDLFNAFNSDIYTAVASTQFNATTYQQPSVILQGRIIRVGVDVKW